MQNCELFQSICEGGVGGWEERGGKGLGEGGVGRLGYCEHLRKRRLYYMVHTILYHCPSRTIIDMHVCTTCHRLSVCLWFDLVVLLAGL